MTHWIEADDFVLTDATRLEKITFWDIEADSFFAGSFVWQLYTDDGGSVPGQLLYSGTSTDLSHTATGLTVSGFREFVNTFSIVPISLPPGRYWLGLHNGELENNSSRNVFWEAASIDHGYASHAKVAPSIGGWLTNAFPGLPSDLAFQFNGVIAPRVSAFESQDGVPRLSFTTTSGFIYRVDYRDSLAGAPWLPLPGAERIEGSGGVIQVSDFDNTGARSSRFYRAALAYNGVTVTVSTFASNSGRPQVSFATVSGYYYRVEYKNNLADSSWTAVSGAELIAGTGGIVAIKDFDADTLGSSQRFYRVILF